MDQSLLEAATCGDATIAKHLALHNPGMLLGTTPHGNTCLHISSIYGHLGFCTDVVALNRSLLSSVNKDGETPLLIAMTSGHATLASFLLKCYRDLKLSEAILKPDKQGCNVLHHAIRSGHRELAMENYVEIFEKLLGIPYSEAEGAKGYNALHAAVRSGNSSIVKRIMETRPELARKESKYRRGPMQLAVNWDNIDMLNVMLEYDRSLGYEINSEGYCLLHFAAHRGHIGVTRELLKHCPDAPCWNTNGWSCLHEAVLYGHENFLEFVLEAQQLHKLINMRSSEGKTALHYAVQKCNPRMVGALLRHKDIDATVFDNDGVLPTWLLYYSREHAKTLNSGYNEVSMLMLKANPEEETDLRRSAKEAVTNRSRKDIKSLTETYTSNTSLVAILISTITFAAAFTLPGGYSSDAGNEGLPIMGRKLAFQAFLIADTLAMCSSLSVAFICIIARWEDLEFLLYYRSFTKKLMWFAYMATTTAFAAGLYTVLAPRLLWLAVAVCILSALLPLFTKLLGEWPVLKLRFRLGRTFKSEFLDMV
ncbi:hypothetical protein EJB05_33243, partial [Eragrostis curvula]